MLTFLRRIRKGLLEGGATSKYLLYAIGEIALVVIGILIALQINNWNEWRKDRIIEVKVLQELHKTLELNSDILNGYIYTMKRSIASKNIVLNHVRNRLPYSDTLDAHFNRARFQYTFNFISSAGYEELKNIGLYIIQSDTLKQEIVNLFQNTYPRIQQNVQQFQPMDLTIRKYMDENFIWTSNRDNQKGSFTPVNYDNLVKDRYYETIMVRLGEERWWFYEQYSEALEESQRILQLIKDELVE